METGTVKERMAVIHKMRTVYRKHRLAKKQHEIFPVKNGHLYSGVENRAVQTPNKETRRSLFIPATNVAFDPDETVIKA